jgi:hypothetical protein
MDKNEKIHTSIMEGRFILFIKSGEVTTKIWYLTVGALVLAVGK